MRPLNTILVALACLLVLGLGPRQVAGEPLVVGLIPAENNEEMIRQFEPMRVYLAAKLDTDVKVYTATDYAGVIEAMRRKRVDVAWYGPMSYYLAELEAGAEAFAVGVRAKTGRSSYRGIFVVATDSPFRTLADLAGKSVAFVDPASTSGGLVPTYITRKATGKAPEAFFGKLVYAGSHDAALLAVKNGTVDAAASNDITYERMLNVGLLDDATTRVLTFSDDLPGAPLTYRGDLDPDLKARIQEVFVTAHHEIEVTGYGSLIRYDAVGPGDFQIIRDMVRELGLKKERILH
ncbi:MAG: phosphonate ABC transporter substrate-binding protein [Alphaproteobacteria bacterium]|nr:phosphonate ABC transporter substrate-binding protein [Alphaproteobacteria bacterium]